MTWVQFFIGLSFNAFFQCTGLDMGPTRPCPVQCKGYILSSILGLSANFKFLSTRNFFIKLWLFHSLVSYVGVKENMYDIIYFVFLKFVLNLFFVFQIYKVTAFTLSFFFSKVLSFYYFNVKFNPYHFRSNLLIYHINALRNL